MDMCLHTSQQLPAAQQPSDCSTSNQLTAVNLIRSSVITASSRHTVGSSQPTGASQHITEGSNGFEPLANGHQLLIDASVEENQRTAMPSDRLVPDASPGSTPAPAPLAPTGLSRWSSEPASLSSADDNSNNGVCTELLERTNRSIATLQRELTAKAELCRALEAALERERTHNRAASFDAIVRCIEQERTENRQLHALVRHQKKSISKLRQRLRSAGLRHTAAGCNDADNNSDREGSSDEEGFLMIPKDGKPEESTEVSENQLVKKRTFQKHRRAVSDFGAVALNHQSSSSRAAIQLPAVIITGDPTATGNFRHRDAPIVAATAENAVLSRRLRDTVEMCQKLARSLDAQTRSHDAGKIRSSSPRAAQRLAADMMPCAETCEAQTTDVNCSELMAVKARLTEVEAMNERWQRYMEQRDEYTRALEQHCSELELALNSKPTQQELSTEQQQHVDRILLEQRQKMELAEEAMTKLEADNAQLKLKCQQQEMCISQLVNKLKEVDALRRTEKEMYDAQLTVYKDDFTSEQHDRHRAQERVVNLERQLASVMQRLRRYESGSLSLRNMIQTAPVRPQIYDSFGSSQHDGSLQLLVGRGSSGSPVDEDYHVRPDTPPRSN